MHLERQKPQGPRRHTNLAYVIEEQQLTKEPLWYAGNQGCAKGNTLEGGKAQTFSHTETVFLRGRGWHRKAMADANFTPIR